MQGDHPREMVAVIVTNLMEIKLILARLLGIKEYLSALCALLEHWSGCFYHLENILYDIIIKPTFVVHALDCRIHQLEQSLFL